MNIITSIFEIPCSILGVFRKNLYPMLALMAIPTRDTDLVQQASAPRLRTFISFACPKETNQRKGHHQIKRALLSPFAQILLNFIQENASIKASTTHHHAFGGRPRADLLNNEYIFANYYFSEHPWLDIRYSRNEPVQQGSFARLRITATKQIIIPSPHLGGHRRGTATCLTLSAFDTPIHRINTALATNSRPLYQKPRKSGLSAKYTTSPRPTCSIPMTVPLRK